MSIFVQSFFLILTSLELSLILLVLFVSSSTQGELTKEVTPLLLGDSGIIDCSEYQHHVPLWTNSKDEVTLSFSYVVTAPLPNPENTSPTLHGRLTYSGLAWIALGVSPTGFMPNSEAIIGYPNEPNSAQNPGKYLLESYQPSSVNLHPKQTLTNHTIEQTYEEDNPEIGDQTVLIFSKLLSEPDNKVEIVADGEYLNKFLWAYGSDNESQYHGRAGRFKAPLTVCVDGGKKVEDGGAIISVLTRKGKSFYKAHGILAALAWGLMVPLAIASSSLRSLFPPGKTWLRTHIALNSLSVIFTMISFGLVYHTMGSNGYSHFMTTHHKLGLGMTFFSALQMVNGLLRPAASITQKILVTDETNQTSASIATKDKAPQNKNDTDDIKRENNLHENDSSADEEEQKVKETESVLLKSTIRIVWELFHKPVGFTLIGCGVWQIQSGLFIYSKIFLGPDFRTLLW
eukprot:CAMPEP_0194414280 /NCGR_PEP_ID=MMETSP0176-20130528/12898_1 /TAXON_ID=216777 /ORGANISM="Proboscia alata, Strain PI-D3" /LENGTH=457 /DNA_ID=CAMNT_0039218157 /DNA_START=32 /DNA_END=1402 /DNA_ORIENTATION=+